RLRARLRTPHRAALQRAGGREMCGERPSLGGLLGAVTGTRLLAVCDTRGVECGADDLVAEPRQVGRPAAANQHNRVLLEVVALAGDVGTDLLPVRQPNARNLPQSRIRLTRRIGVHASADAPLLRRALQRRALGLALCALAALADELIDGRHVPPEKSLFTQQRSAGPFDPANRTTDGTETRTPLQTGKPAWKAHLRGRFARFLTTAVIVAFLVANRGEVGEAGLQ